MENISRGRYKVQQNTKYLFDDENLLIMDYYLLLKYIGNIGMNYDSLFIS